MMRYNNIIRSGLDCLSNGRMTPYRYKMLCKGIEAEKNLCELEILHKLKEEHKFREMFDKCYDMKEFAKHLVDDEDNDREYARRRRSHITGRFYDRMDDRDGYDDREYAVDRRLRSNRIYRDDRRRYSVMEDYPHHLPYDGDYNVGYQHRMYDKMDNDSQEKIYHEIEQYLKMNAVPVYETLKHYPKNQWAMYLKNNQPHIYEMYKDRLYI